MSNTFRLRENPITNCRREHNWSWPLSLCILYQKEERGGGGVRSRGFSYQSSPGAPVSPEDIYQFISLSSLIDTDEDIDEETDECLTVVLIVHRFHKAMGGVLLTHTVTVLLCVCSAL
jgi:hypothetical protein